MNRKRGGLFAGVIVGLIMLVVFTVVVFRNEGNAVHREKALEHIDQAVEISSNGASSQENGTLVILSGDISVDDTLKDETFMVVAPKDTIKMKKSVSLYQWVESSETDDDDNTTYEYDTMWVEYLVDSSDFEYESNHRNPEAMIYTSQDFIAEDVLLGNYYLDDVFINQLNRYEEYKNMEVPAMNLTHQINENKIFISDNGKSTISLPDIGDYLIEFEIVSTETITAVGGIQGSNIISYHTKTGNLNEVSYGVKDKAVIKQEKIDENNRRTWAIRIGSVFALMLAIGMLFSPITKLLGRIPIIGNIVNGGIALVGGIIGGAWGIVVIAIGWLYYKPVLAIGMIVGVIAIILLVSRAKKDKTPQT